MARQTTSFLRPILREPRAPWRLVNGRTGKVVAQQVTTAVDSVSRRKGLLGRDSLDACSALLIAPTNGIHTWFMRFDIDVAFVDKSGRIVKIRHRLKPWRMFLALRGFAAVELPPGTLAASETVSGDMLVLTKEQRS